MSEYKMTVNEHEIACHPDDTAILVFSRNHLLDHLVIVEGLIETPDAIVVPRGYRLYRELFERNDLSFDDVATELASMRCPVIPMDGDIPDYFLEQYSALACQSLDSEWSYYAREWS